MSTALATLPDMSTTNGQKQHYAAVRLRLYGKPPVAIVRRQAVTPKSAKAVRLDRDYLFVRSFAGKIIATQGGIWNRALADQIIEQCSEKHDVSLAEMKGRGRGRAVVAARFEAYYRMKTELGYSLPMIGEAMGGREHTGVMHGINKHKARMAAQ